MKNNRFLSTSIASILTFVVAPLGAQATTSTFTATVSPADYQAAGNWSSGVPNAIDDSALLTTDIPAGTLQVNLNGAVTLGNLTIGDANSATNGFYSLNAGTGGSLTFDVTAGNATLQKTLGIGSTDTIASNVTLNDTLAADIRSSGTINITGIVSGTGGIIRSGSVSNGGVSTNVTTGILGLTNVNSYTGSTIIEQGIIQATLNGDIALSTNSVLGNSATAIVIGNPTFAPATAAADAQALRFLAGSDATNYTIARAIDFSGVTLAGAGQSTLTFQGDVAGGLNTNTLTISGVTSLGARTSVVNIQPQRVGQTINFTGDITGTGAGVTAGVLIGTSGTLPTVDGRASGTVRFSNLNRGFTNPVSLNQGTILIDGVVGALGTSSPIGTTAIGLANGGGSGNIVGNSNFSGNTGSNDTSIDTIRSVILDTAGSSYARILAPGGGNTSTPATGGYTTAVNVINGFQFGGRNTTGLTTFSGAVTPTTPAVGNSPTNPITVAINMALESGNGGTTLFSGGISDGTTVAGTVTRVTINQFRNNPSIDATTGVAATAGSDGVPDPAFANVLVGTATTGTVVVQNTNTWDGTTEVLGGKFLVSGSITGDTLTVASGALLGGSGTIGTGTVNPGTIQVSGTVDPGGQIDPVTPANGAIAGIGTLTTTKSVFFLAGSTFSIQTGVGAGNNDKFAITGNLDLSTATDTLALSGTLDGVTTYTIATFTGTLAGVFNTVTGLTGGYTVGYNANSITLNAVPEPSTWALLTGGLGLLVGFQRRRRR